MAGIELSDNEMAVYGEVWRIRTGEKDNGKIYSC
jgi:hypothetical protein